MATKGGSKIFWIIGGLIVVAGSVGAYFLLRKPKEEGGNEDGELDLDLGSDSGSGSGGSTNIAPAELGDSTKIKAFQDWMDKKGKGWILKDGKWVLLNKGKGYGNYGDSTEAVWKVFGKDYLATKGVTPTIKPSLEDKDKSSSADVKAILKYAKGVTEAGLKSLSKSQAKSWADAIKNGKTIYLFNNKVYSTIYGEKILDYNPLNKKHYTTKEGLFFKATSQLDSQGFNSSIGRDLGKVGSIVYRLDSKGNGVTLFWMPDAELWIFANATSTKNPTSSFMGDKMDLDMFSTFDNNLDLNL
jgi:hypothetical protein